MTRTIDVQMRAVLTQLELCSSGATQAWNASGGGSGEPDDRLVNLVIRSEEPTYLRYARRWDGCKSDRSRQLVLDEAKAELEHWRKRQAPVAESIPLEQMILEDGQGKDVLLVASQFRVDQALVRRLRARHSRDQDTGLPLDGLPRPEPSERRTEALRLQANGLTYRQIAMYLGCTATTVMRDLKVKDAA
jgi:hypothetical protein